MAKIRGTPKAKETSRKETDVSEATSEHDPVAERVAENESRFREANEDINAIAAKTDLPHIPFVCECADLCCTEILRLSHSEYEEIRDDGRHFLNAPGHQTAARGWAVVVAERDGYVVVEKLAEAGEISENLDPRGGGGDG
jgi:hypothetical protein